LSIPGVTILDFDTLQNEFDSRLFPLLAPDLFTPIAVQSVKRDSYGDGTTAKQTIMYTLPYTLACFQQGEGRGLQDIVPELLAATSDVMTAIVKHDTPGDLEVDLTILTAQINTTVNDPNGTGYHGSKLVLLVKEFVEGVI